MKISCFHLMPYRDLPDDFAEKHKSAFFTLPFHEVADRHKISQYYNWTLDELIFAAKSGFDGVCTNEHHQNAYGFMVNPNMMGSILARATRDLNLKTAIVQMGETAVFLNPPIRVAEEYAMLDSISEGRMVAGMPVGVGGDFAYSYGYAPITERERYKEAHDLIKKAWAAKEIFAWNGQYYQLPMVNVWPRPVQEPHPPIWVPGNASPGTWDFVAENDYAYCYLTYFGAKGADTAVNGYWRTVEKHGREPNPYRLGYLIPVAVSETDAKAAEEFGKHAEYFYHKLLKLPSNLFFPPGFLTHSGLEYLMVNKPLPDPEETKNYRFKDFNEQDYLVVGSAETVTERLIEIIKRLRVGNLMLLLQFGSMPHELAMENIDRVAKNVLPHLRGIWDDEGWKNHWWPQGARVEKRKAA